MPLASTSVSKSTSTTLLSRPNPGAVNSGIRRVACVKVQESYGVRTRSSGWSRSQLPAPMGKSRLSSATRRNSASSSASFSGRLAARLSACEKSFVTSYSSHSSFAESQAAIRGSDAGVFQG